MAWKCPKCESENTRELWDNTGLGGDIKCDDCGNIWDEKPKRGGLRNPLGGRPRKPAELKRRRCGDITLPKWLHSWLMAQDTPAGHIVEQALIEKFNLQPPSP